MVSFLSAVQTRDVEFVVDLDMDDESVRPEVAKQAEALLHEFDRHMHHVSDNLYDMLDMFAKLYAIATEGKGKKQSHAIAQILRIRTPDGHPLVTTTQEALALLGTLQSLPSGDDLRAFSKSVSRTFAEESDEYHGKHLGGGGPSTGGGGPSTGGGGGMEHLNAALGHVSGIFTEIDEANQEMAETYGLTAFENMPGMIVIPPGVPVPPKMLVTVLYVLAEVLRLLVASSPIGMPYVGIALSILVFLVDIGRGQWKHGIITLIGMLNRYALLMSFAGKVLMSTFEMLSPDVRDRMFGVISDLRTSLLLGFSLWAIDIVLPGPARALLQQLQATAMRIAGQIDNVSETAETTARQTLAPLGKSVDMPRFSPLIAKYKVTDLTSLQDILLNPRIYCDPEVQKLIESAKQISVLSLVFSMIGIPPAGASPAACAELAATPLVDAILPMPRVYDVSGGVGNVAEQLHGKLQGIADPSAALREAASHAVPKGLATAISDPSAALREAASHAVPKGLATAISDPSAALREAASHAVPKGLATAISDPSAALREATSHAVPTVAPHAIA